MSPPVHVPKLGEIAMYLSMQFRGGPGMVAKGVTTAVSLI